VSRVGGGPSGGQKKRVMVRLDNAPTEKGKLCGGTTEVGGQGKPKAGAGKPLDRKGVVTWKKGPGKRILKKRGKTCGKTEEENPSGGRGRCATSCVHWGRKETYTKKMRVEEKKGQKFVCG